MCYFVFLILYYFWFISWLTHQIFLNEVKLEPFFWAFLTRLLYFYLINYDFFIGQFSPFSYTHYILIYYIKCIIHFFMKLFIIYYNLTSICILVKFYLTVVYIHKHEFTILTNAFWVQTCIYSFDP